MKKILKEDDIADERHPRYYSSRQGVMTVFDVTDSVEYYLIELSLFFYISCVHCVHIISIQRSFDNIPHLLSRYEYYSSEDCCRILVGDLCQLADTERVIDFTRAQVNVCFSYSYGLFLPK